MFSTIILWGDSSSRTERKTIWMLMLSCMGVALSSDEVAEERVFIA